MPLYVVGVDGGTTKTVAVVADEQGNVVGAARGGGSNWTGDDVEIPMGVVVATVQAALETAGLCGDDIAVGVFCLAGADWPEDHVRRHDFLAQSRVARRVIVKNDAFAGLRAGTHQPYGVVIAAGTGSNTAVITPDGREWAYGYYVDVGGAHDLAREAIRAVLHQEDGRGLPTALSGMVLEKLGLPTAEALLRALLADQVERGQIMALCPLVFAAADGGDEVAAEIITRQGQALAEYATVAIRRFAMQGLEFEVVLSGSVFKGQGPLLVDTIVQAIHRVAPRARIVRARLEPVAGSVLLAYDALGSAVTAEMYANLTQTVPGAEFFNTADGGKLPPFRRRSRA